MRGGHKREFARGLRANMTDAELYLWRHLRQRQIGGNRFRRQHPVGPYIADFVCIEQRLIIEVDGGQHADSSSDLRRGDHLRAAGYCVIRFWNNDVLSNIEGVIAEISAALETARPHPNLPPQAGEGA